MKWLMTHRLQWLHAGGLPKPHQQQPFAHAPNPIWTAASMSNTLRPRMDPNTRFLRLAKAAQCRLTHSENRAVRRESGFGATATIVWIHLVRVMVPSF